MPTQLEEVVIHADTRQTKDLSENAAEDLLLHRRRATARHCGSEVRSGQGTPIELAVHRQRQFVQHHQCGRDHV
ncbi:hypothetical protein ABZ943_39105, partial [Streptomyces rubiginosohelvolus]|uniref:hypothetical protein n=1 Tax=Streptomyces rubiginosohelvolus TaxID=67362 RepID=UPI0033D2589D